MMRMTRKRRFGISLTAFVLCIERCSGSSSLGVAGAGATKDGYDSGTYNPICWSGVEASTRRQLATTTATEDNAFRIQQDAGSKAIPYPNSLVSNFTLQEALQLEETCFEGVDIHVTQPVEFLYSQPRANRVYTYRIEGSIDLTTFPGSNNTVVTNDRNTSEIGVQIHLCRLESLGYCSPLLGQLSHSDREEPVSVRSSEFATVYLSSQGTFSALVPITVKEQGGFSIVGSVLLFRSDKDSGETPLYINLLANMPNTTDARVVHYQNEPDILTVSKSSRITAIVLSSVSALVLMFLIWHLFRFRHNQVLNLVQGKFLQVMVFAGMIACCFSFSFEPTRINCHLTGPFVILPVHLMFAVCAGRLWRINAVISPLLLLTLDRRKQTVMKRLVDGIQTVVMCSNPKNIRKQITDVDLAKVILLFISPQLAIQIAIAIVQPNSFVLTLNDEGTQGTYHCGENGVLRSPLEGTSLILLAVMLLIVLALASSSRDLPSLFNETKVLFDVTLLSVIIMVLAAVVVGLSDTASSDPNLWYMVCVIAVCAICLIVCIKIVWPKLNKVWSGEVVVVSKLISDHNEKRQSTRGPSIPDFAPRSSLVLLNDSSEKNVKESETDRESSVEFFNKQKGTVKSQDDQHDLESGQRYQQTQNSPQAGAKRRLSRMSSSMDMFNTESIIQHPDASVNVAERVSHELETPGQHIYRVSEDETPSRQLLLLMIDLQKLLQKMNRSLLEGTRVDQEEWQRLRNASTTLGRVFTRNVQFSWELNDPPSSEEDALQETTDEAHLATVADDSNSSIGSMTTQQMGDIAAALRKNVEVKDRQYRLVKYPSCFVACEAVDFLVTSGIASSRAEAVHLGRRLAQKIHLFAHVTNDHEFSDDYLFFRFGGNLALGNSKLTNVLCEIEEEESQGAPACDQSAQISLESGWRSNPERLHFNLAKVVLELRKHVEVKDRWYRMVLYRQCFVARDAVSYLVHSGIASSREEAVEIGLLLADTYKVFEHVCKDHSFKDGYLFFRFIDASATEADMDQSIHSVDIHGNTKSDISELNSDIGSMFSGTKSPWRSMSDAALSEVAIALKNNVQVMDRKYHARLYKKCFIASEAIDFLVGAGYALSRKDAVQLGRCLSSKFNLFEHVCGDHKLKDGYLFFVFNKNHTIGDSASKEDSVPSQSMGKHADDGSGSVSSSKVSHQSQHRDWKAMSDHSLAKIALALKTGVPVRDRRYHLVLFKKCFVGRQAVDFLVNSGFATSRRSATELARALMSKFDIFEHVTREHDFADSYKFYRFIEGNSTYKHSIRRRSDLFEKGSSIGTSTTGERRAGLQRLKSMPTLRNVPKEIGKDLPDTLISDDKARAIQTIHEGDATAGKSSCDTSSSDSFSIKSAKTNRVLHPFGKPQQKIFTPSSEKKDQSKAINLMSPAVKEDGSQTTDQTKDKMVAGLAFREKGTGAQSEDQENDADKTSIGRASAKERLKEAKESLGKAMQTVTESLSAPPSPESGSVDTCIYRISERTLEVESERSLDVDSDENVGTVRSGDDKLPENQYTA